MKSLHFHIPEAWKRYPFPAEPSSMGHHREYPHPARLCTYLFCGELFKEQSVCLWYWWWIRLRFTQGQVLLLVRKVTAQVIYSIFFKLGNITWTSEVFCGTQYFPAKPTTQKTATSAGKLAIKNSRKQRAKGECPLAGSSRLKWRGCLLNEERSIFPFFSSYWVSNRPPRRLLSVSKSIGRFGRIKIMITGAGVFNRFVSIHY